MIKAERDIIETNKSNASRKIWVTFEVRVQRVEVFEVQSLDHGLTLLCNPKNHRRVTHAIHHRLGFVLTFRHFALRVQKVEAHELEIVVGEIPTVVHSRSQKAVGANHVKQCADHLLARTGRLTGSTIRGLKVLDDGSAVANHFALWGHQSGDGRQFAFGEHLRLETLVPC